MRINIFVLTVSIFFCISCQTEGLVSVSDQPVFYINGFVNGEAISFSAGVKGVVNTPIVNKQNDNWDYISTFSIDDPQASIRSLSFKFNDYNGVFDENELNSLLKNEDLNYVLNFTGVEGVVLEPETNSIIGPFITAWTIGGRDITTQLAPIVPLPFLEESEYVDVKYNLNVINTFRGILNSQINMDPNKSCHSSLHITIEGEKADLELDPFQTAFTDVQWSNGSNTLSTQIDLVAQEIVVEASNDFCQTIAQLEIKDPNALPDILAYNLNISEGPATFLSNTGLIIEAVDNDGTIYRSDFGNQSGEPILNFDIAGLHTTPLDGFQTFVVSGNISCQLGNIDVDKSISLDLTDLQLALSIPNP